MTKVKNSQSGNVYNVLANIGRIKKVKDRQREEREEKSSGKKCKQKLKLFPIDFESYFVKVGVS